MKLTRYGAAQWIGGSIVLALLIAVSAFFAARGIWVLWLMVPVLALIWIWVIAFFRDPQRTPPHDAGLFVSPADGKVTDITPIGVDSFLGREGMKVGVFMSVFDVHVNRAPFDARVERVEHRKGIFLDARDPLSSEKNESATIYLTVTHGGREWPVVVRQVAGFVARRIVTDLREGQQLRRGERIGMIRFGSRCELLVPTELAGAVRVQMGQHVSAGLTPLISTPDASKD